MVQGNLAIRYHWDGRALAEAECVSLALRSDARALHVVIDSPYYADPAPSAPPGSLEGLWDFEVVELFLLGDGERYLELEFGPHGHSLALEFDGARKRIRSGLEVQYQATVVGSRWRGVAGIALDLVPPGLRACNAYAIHGTDATRRYLACYALDGVIPDFHRLDCFGPLPQ